MNWKPLKLGDTVDLVAPASRCSQRELKSAIQSVRKMGLQPRLAKNIFGTHPYLSHTDEKRFEFLGRALTSSTSKAVWCLRGGYGSLRLLPMLASMKPPPPKLFIGLSDISTLHNFFNQCWGWPTLHGPMLGNLEQRSAKERNEILNVVFGRVNELEYKRLKPMNALAFKNTRLRSSIAGGNLMTVQSSQGTPWAFSGAGRIVFFEEVNERGYRVDRLLMSLNQSGYFKKSKAIIFGDFIEGNEPDGRDFVKRTLKDFAQFIGVPVFSGLPSGHGKLRRTLPFGTSATLDFRARTLTVRCGTEVV